MKPTSPFISFLWLFLLSPCMGEEPADLPASFDAKMAGERFDRLLALVKPQSGESKWARIPWLTNLEEARKRSQSDDKPLLLWRAGGGEVLGRA